MTAIPLTELLSDKLCHASPVMHEDMLAWVEIMCDSHIQCTQHQQPVKIARAGLHVWDLTQITSAAMHAGSAQS